MFCNISQASVGIGISGNNQEILIDGFPHYGEYVFTLFNSGDRGALYTVSVVAEYADVASWIEVEPKLISLERGEYREIRYSLNAEEGYAGEYGIKIRVIGFEDDMSSQDKDLENVSYLKACSSIGLKINVLESAGKSSLGTKHPPKGADSGDNSQFFKEIVDNIESSGSGISVTQTSSPIYVDIPKILENGMEVELDVGYIGGSDTNGLAITLLSPSDISVFLVPGEIFKFDEVGIWGLLVSVEGETALARSIEVVNPQRGSGRLGMMFLGSIGMVFTIPIYLRRRNRAR